MLRIIRSVYNFVTDLHLLPFGKDSILNNNYSDDQPLVRLGQGDYEREIWYSAHSRDVPTWDKETSGELD